MKKSKKLVSLLLCLALVFTGSVFAFGADTQVKSDDSYMKELVEVLGEDLDGEQMFDYLSYVYLGWRTTGGPWQNQVIDDFARGELVDAGYVDAGVGYSDQNSKSDNDKSSAHDNDYAWTTYFNDITSLTWSPEYCKLELSTESTVAGLDELIEAVNVESYAFDPTCDTYQEYYSKEKNIAAADNDSAWIDGMWRWITTKDAAGNRVYVNKEHPQAGEESQLQKRVHLAWNSCFTDDRGTKPEDAVGATGEVVYVGTVDNKNGTCSAGIAAEDLAGKVLLTDSTLSQSFTFAQKVGAIAVASKRSLSNYSQPKDDQGNWIEPYYDSARYASGASLTNTKAATENGKPIVEWQFSNRQYDALKELLQKADAPVIAKNVAIGTAYAMNDEKKGGKGQAITVAEIKGATKPDERVFLCAHVQEPGSNDNATGVAALLGMATAYKKMIDEGKIARPERTITFMWGDEMSMATLYMSSHSVEKQNILSVLDLDMVGEDPDKTGGVMRIEKTPDPSAVYNYTLDALPWEDGGKYLDENFADPDGLFTRLPDSHTLWGAGSISGMFQEGFYLNDLYMYATQTVIANHDNTFQVDVCPYEGGSDHSRFLAKGIPAMLTWHFTDYTYHTSVDSLALSSASEMENVGITSMAAAIQIADCVDANEEVALEMLEMVKTAALDRMVTERQNTINHQKYAKANGGDYAAALDLEKEVINAWADWYDEALFSVEGLLDSPSRAYITAREDARRELEAARKSGLGFAEETIKARPLHADVAHFALDPATMDWDGNIEFWMCEGCQTIYGDPSYTEIIQAEDILIPQIATAYLDKTSYVYDGKVKNPTVTVLDANWDELVEGVDYDVTYSVGCKAVGKYKATVEFKGNYAGTEVLTFKILPKKAAVKSAVAGKGKVTVKATTKASAKGGAAYQVAYKVKGAKTWKYTTTTTATKVIKNLKKGKVYQVKVRAYKTVKGVKYYGAWSTVKTTKKVK